MQSKNMAVKIADSLKATVILNDGVRMPMFGLGMFRSGGGEGGEAEAAVCHALQTGYRLIDTAVFHGTEEDIGRGIKKSGVKREDIFIVSKPWIDSHGSEKVKEAFRESLKKLDIKYVDLYMIHSPAGGKNVETYKAIQELKKEGLVRSVGVSNFNIHHLEGLKKAELPTPSVNQIELHPWMRRAEAVNYCRKEGITVMGYSPLAKGQNINDPTIASLSKKYNKSVGQIIVRWSVQSGFITIPKTAKLHRIVENSQVFDWSLDKEDMNTMVSYSVELKRRNKGGLIRILLDDGRSSVVPETVHISQQINSSMQ